METEKGNMNNNFVISNTLITMKEISTCFQFSSIKSISNWMNKFYYDLNWNKMNTDTEYSLFSWRTLHTTAQCTHRVKLIRCHCHCKSVINFNLIATYIDVNEATMWSYISMKIVCLCIFIYRTMLLLFYLFWKRTCVQGKQQKNVCIKFKYTFRYVLNGHMCCPQFVM